MKRILITLVLAALTGCTVTKPISAPPPLPTDVKARTSVAQAKSVVQAKSAVQAAASTALETWAPEKLYIDNRNGVYYLGWLTNVTKSVLITTTDLTTPMKQWQILGTQCKFKEGDRWLIQVTNRYDTARFYRLLSVPTNNIILSWSCPSTAETNVIGFNLLEGPAPLTYTKTTPIPGQVLWTLHPGATDLTFYAVVGYDTYGMTSLSTTEVFVDPLSLTNPFAPPCP